MREIATIRQTSYKFASIFNENEHFKIKEESKENDTLNLEDQESEMEQETDDDLMNKKKLDTYSFGIRWYYWEYYKDLDESDEINGGEFKDYYIPSVHKVCLSMFDVMHIFVFLINVFLWSGFEG